LIFAALATRANVDTFRRYYRIRRFDKSTTIYVHACMHTYMHTYRVAPKNWHTFLHALTSYALTSSNIDGFSSLFHSLSQKSNNTVTTDPTIPQMCRYTTFWNIMS